MRKRFFLWQISSAASDRLGPPRVRRTLRCAGATFVAVLVGAVPARAMDDEPAHSNEFEITPFIGYMAGGEFEDPVDGTDRDLDADTSWGVILNAAVEPWRHYELLYTNQSTQLTGITTLDVDVQYLQIGGTVSHPDAERVIPYFGLTVGAAQFSPDQPGLDDETNLAFSIAGGLRIPITDHIGLRFDARAFVTVLESDSDIFCVSSAGLTCRIGTKSDTFLQYAASLGITIAF